MTERARIDEDLVRYADHRLPAAEAAELERQLAGKADERARVDDWRAQDEAIRMAFSPILAEEIPERLLAAASVPAPDVAAHPPRWRIAAAVGWLAIGLIAGFVIGRDGSGPANAERIAGLPHDALIAHAVYAPEIRHPVEVAASERAHLLGWLSKRAGTTIRAPALESEGFQLMGGRLVTSHDGPGAMLMYENVTGQRLSLVLCRDEDETTTAFRYAQKDRIGVFYWIDGGVGYALSGELPREQLLKLATTVYRQLNP
ncbi:anti-sigma factor family protein [Cognatazoarcus halotolerans]|uniref:anti-sigma factor family protein n=1 Tax=Cognatazoarcus halotolerans TaxID=2686016 RepID=UPI00135C9E92|nr:anti-sigma factor [Cognatazoarcus halotolerans]MBX3678687.1 anti-sigma factor [Rhodocyclaceae bacterium]MCB1899494.1 anti-sigma factor [Rhodocyclaceae bacterium]MCP5309432.1 anti-sigma factor [Zoogloeaceae bacterium]